MVLNRARALRAAGVMLVAATALTVALAQHNLRGPIQSVDDAVLRFMEAIRVPPLTWLSRLLNVAGSVLVTWPLRIVAAAVLIWKRQYLELAAFLTIVATSELCIGPLKAFVDRPRPPDPMVLTTGASYPSGHAIATAVTAVGVVIALIPPGRRRLKWEVYAGLITFVMALSRVYLGAHWFSDVVGGMLIGLGLSLLWPATFEEARVRRRAVDSRGG
jgi:membrane-associated phospholipid phosphatase